MMNKTLFELLLSSFKGAPIEFGKIAKDTLITDEECKREYENAIRVGLLDQTAKITDKGIKELAPYKVENAIIMAAGLSSRCLPLSKIVPKGLFQVKGEVLLEREIEQLKEAGIEKIILVVGYLKEQFEYLKEKYNITIIENSEYRSRNNTSSIYAARNYLSNSYICCADNYFADNIFEPYVFDSYYTCKYTKEYLDEFCLTEIENGYIKKIHRGGENCYYTMGAVYFNRTFSKKFIKLLSHEYDHDDVKGMLIDTFHVVHMDDLPATTYKVYNDDEIKEFDTLKEFAEFDFGFHDFYNEVMTKSLFERYSDISRYAGVPTDWVTGRLHYNENLFGPTPKCLEVLYKTTMEDLYLYDSTEDDDLLIALEKKLKISRRNLFLHNGSAESIKSLFSIMLEKGDTVLIPSPGWSYYASIIGYKFGQAICYDIIEGNEKCIHSIEDIMEKAQRFNPKVIVITSPAMPTGNKISADALEEVVRNNPGTMVLVDEAYYGFCDYDIDVKYMISTYDNVIFSRTFSKYYALANMRIGYGICSKNAMHTLWLDLPLHRLSHITKRMAIAALSDDEYYKEITQEIIDVREWFRNELNKIPDIKAFKSDANFIYIALEKHNVSAIKKYMEANGYLIRIFESHKEQHLRITIAQKEVMEDCLHKLKRALKIYTS